MIVGPALVTGRAAVFAVSLRLVRSQATVGPVSCTKAMIPHQSIAAMQVREIGEMKELVRELDGQRQLSPRSTLLP